MIDGLSTSRRCDSSAACLPTSNKHFVFRYHSRETQQPEKRLTPVEAATLARAGLDLATVYQDRARQEADFGAERGLRDGASALVFAGQIGQPPGSAVYFAVDVDFSLAQIRSVVLPYFRAVESAFETGGKGAAYYRIGVYGSGLTCRVLKEELDFVAFTWLAESTGWRESRTYTGWDVKQFLNTGTPLCSLATAYEDCQAKAPGFGEFKPVGFALGAGEGESRSVATAMLNLRAAPTTSFNTPLAQLPERHPVRVMGVSAPGWVRIRTSLNGSDVIGHVSEALLSPANAAPPVLAPLVAASTQVPAVYLGENKASASRASVNGRAYPIGEPGRPVRKPADAAATRCLQLGKIADWLSVETSARYRPTGVTFCNIYATDYAYLAGAYLPRVWWKEKALMAIAAGSVPDVVYDQTVRELRADDLHTWLLEWGDSFGWRRVFDASALQRSANAGGLGLICADRKAAGLSGHITVVVPETASHTARRDPDGNVTQPLQSQAGSSNHRYGSSGDSWWLGAQFVSFVMFVHE